LTLLLNFYVFKFLFPSFFAHVFIQNN